MLIDVGKHGRKAFAVAVPARWAWLEKMTFDAGHVIRRFNLKSNVTHKITTPSKFNLPQRGLFGN